MANQSDQTPGKGAQNTGKSSTAGSTSGTTQNNQSTQTSAGSTGGGMSGGTLGSTGGQTGSGMTGSSTGKTGGGTGSGQGSMSTPDRTGSGGTGTATARSFYDQAKETASEAYEVAAEKATTKLEEQKSTLSSGLSSVADSVRKVSQNLQGQDVKDGMAKFTADYSDTAAKKIEQVANYFERKDVREMYGDVERFARQNPAMFIGGAFALGLIAARFLKSSTPNHMAGGGGQSFGKDMGNKGIGGGTGQSTTGTAGMNRADKDAGTNPPIASLT